jgi:nitrogenase subunit NifH
MIDPVTAIAGASKAFAMAKAMVEAGRAAEDTMMQISTWYGHASDVIYADNKAKRASPFKKVIFRKSVEAEAIQAFAAKKKIEAQQRDLITMLNYAYGSQGLLEFRELKKNIAREREETVYRQQELKEALVSSFAIVTMTGLLAGLLMFIITGGK